MGKFLKRRIETIFIMLGNGCNMNCKYCLQHPLVHHELSAEIDPAVYDFIAQVQEENGADSPVNVHFYGGEPLLYWSAIKEFVAHTREYGVSYSIITNGRAVTDEVVDFFNDLESPVTVSWDGPHVLETRGYDVFDPAGPQRALLMRLKLLGVSAVLSARAYPIEVLEAIQALSVEYNAIHGYPLRLNVDKIFDTGGLPDRSLLDMDYDRLSRESRELAEWYLSKNSSSGDGFYLPCDTWEEKDYIRGAYMAEKTAAIRRFLEDGGTYKRVTCCCGNGYQTLNVDLQGNLYACHNTSEACGHISGDYFGYLRRVIAGDPTRERAAVCRDCIAMPFCQGGCKMVSDDALASGYCAMRRAIAAPILDAYMAFGAAAMREQAMEADDGCQRDDCAN